MKVSHVRTPDEANSFGKYRFIAGLGHGGMAAVHLAVVHGLSGFNKLVVLKQVHPEYSEDPEILGMFLDEARLAARLSHPNVVQTNEVGQEGKHHFMAMEYLDGQPLNRILGRLHRDRTLPLAMHLQIIADLLGGLHYAHELADYDGTPLNVVHRDVNPQNVFVTYDGTVKVVDFGIAKARDALTHTRIGIIKGKLSYMAPEQARSDHVDRRADIFSVGVMLWEAATCTRPWKGVAELAMVEALLSGRFPTPRSVAPEVPEALEAIILKALAHDPMDRYATAAELQGVIEAYLDTLGGRLPQRELGKLVATHFEAERNTIRSLIEEQLRSLNRAPDRMARSFPLIDHATVTDEDSGDPRGATTGPRDEPLHQRSGASGPTPFAASMPTQRTGPRYGRGARFLAGAGAFLACAAISALALSLKKAPPVVPVAAPSQAVMAAAVNAPPVAVELRLSVSPMNAQIFVDDQRVEGNPFRGSFSRDERAHRIRVEAPGYVPRVEVVSFDNDLVLDVVLAVEPALTSLRPEPSTALHSSRSDGKQRHLDAKNPYTR